MASRSAKSDPVPRVLPRWDDIAEFVREPTLVRAYLRDGTETTLTPFDLFTILTWHLQDIGLLRQW